MGGNYQSVADVVEAVGPAVVQLLGQPAGFEDFLNVCPKGLGSGVIIDDRGYIFTNHHIVRGSRSVGVVLPDGRSYQGEVLGGDRRRDIALVHIPGDGVPVARLGDTSQIQVGETVIAIGNALGPDTGPTASVGVLSAKGRPVQGQEGIVLHGLIQTDASINPGNSGGPLVTISGSVIGISTAAIPPTQGVGFAVAVEMARPVFEALLASGHVVRPWLGIIAVTANPALAASLGLERKSGVLVVHVEDDSSAYFAGVQAGDIIVSVDGVPIASPIDLQREAAHRRVGDRIKLMVWRGGRQLELATALRELPLR